MATRRTQRLNEQLKREISRIIRREVRGPRVGSVTVTGVEVTPDLASARVWVRGLPGAETDDEVLQGLTAATPHIKRHLGRSLPLRRVPELLFERDATLEHAERIEAILDDVRPEGGWSAGGDESLEDEG
jgi:ribosome-binding factor A